jgi:diacylglycerol kinase
MRMSPKKVNKKSHLYSKKSSFSIKTLKTLYSAEEAFTIYCSLLTVHCSLFIYCTSKSSISKTKTAFLGITEPAGGFLP